MKHCLLLFAALVLSGAASAQRLRLGVRAGMNTSDYRFSTVRIGDTYVSRGGARAGFNVGLVFRYDLSRRFHLQAETDYVFANYAYRLRGGAVHDVRIRAERLEIPVELGFRFAKVLRLFGGAVFRATNSQRSSAPGIFRVKFNDGDVALTGGLGVQIRSFFLDFRITLHPQGRTWNTFTLAGAEPQRVGIGRNILYGGSIGLFF